MFGSTIIVVLEEECIELNSQYSMEIGEFITDADNIELYAGMIIICHYFSTFYLIILILLYLCVLRLPVKRFASFQLLTSTHLSLMFIYLKRW